MFNFRLAETLGKIGKILLFGYISVKTLWEIFRKNLNFCGKNSHNINLSRKYSNLSLIFPCLIMAVNRAKIEFFLFFPYIQ